MPLRKPCSSSEKGSTMPIAPSLGTWGKKHPVVCEFLSSVTWEDGSSRELGSLILFFDREDGRWKACLSCKATARVAFVSGADPEDALSNAEKGLAADRLDWRPQRDRRGGKRS